MPRPTALRRAVAVVAVAGAGLVLAVLASSPAAAHAELVGTDPKDGSVLDAPPGALALTFNEPVQVRSDSVTVLAADGTPVEAAAVPVGATVAITPSTRLGDGTYVVSWRVISLDAHPIAGAFSFSVGGPSTTGVDVVVPEPSAALVAVRAAAQGAVYASAFVVTGLVVFELFVQHASPGAAPVLRRRIQITRRAALVLAATATVLTVPLTVAWQAGDGLGALTRLGTWTTGLSNGITPAALLIGGLALATSTAPRAARCPRATWPAGLAIGGSAVALGSLLLVGHTRTFGPSWLVLTADALHVGAGAVWLGGVVGLALTLTASAGVEPRRAASTVARFSALGGWLVLALALTGATLGWRIVGSLEALVTSTYGRTLLVKIALALLIVAIAAWNRYRLVPAIRVASEHGDRGLEARVPAPRRQLRRSVLAEAALLGLVLAATGALVSTSPVDHSTGADAAAPEAIVVTRPLGEGTLRARVTPGRPGVNSVELELVDADGAPMEPTVTPELTAALPEAGLGPLTHPLTEVAPGRYAATLDLPLPGAWTIEVSVRTSRYENPIAQIPVEVTL